MTRCGAKAAIVVLTRQDEVDSLIPGQGIGMSEEVQRRQPPVDSIQSKML